MIAGGINVGDIFGNHAAVRSRVQEVVRRVIIGVSIRFIADSCSVRGASVESGSGCAGRSYPATARSLFRRGTAIGQMMHVEQPAVAFHKKPPKNGAQFGDIAGPVVTQKRSISV